MTADKTLIDAMADDILRAMYADKYGQAPSDGEVAEIRHMGRHSPWNRTVEVAARAALRALHDHGPTPAMVEAAQRAWTPGLNDAEAHEFRFKAMIAAELKEADNAV